MSVPDDGSSLTEALTGTGTYAEAACNFLRSAAQPGMAALDAGAGPGWFTRVLARAVTDTGSVLALEPDAAVAALIGPNTADHGAPVRVEHAAAWREPGTASVGISTSADVPTVRVDDLVDTLGIARIDNDGTEHVAVQGMERVIARSRPVMLVAFWPRGIQKLGDNPAAVLDYYRELGYDLGLLEAPGLPRLPAADDLIEAADGAPGGRGWLALQPSTARRGTLVELRTVAELIERGPAAGRLGGAGARIRTLLLRLMRPYTAHQNELDRHLLDAIEEVRRALLEARGRAEEQRSGQSRQLRELEQMRAELERVRGAAAELEVIKARLEALEQHPSG
jgi:hypothetical protein